MGAKTDPIDMVLDALNLEGPFPGFIPLRMALLINNNWLEKGFSVGVTPLVFCGKYRGRRVIGATADLLDTAVASGLALAAGEWPNTEAGVAVGAEAARHEGLRVGDVVNVEAWASDASRAPAQSHRMRVAGILKPMGNAWDGALFTDIIHAQVLLGRFDASAPAPASACASWPERRFLRLVRRNAWLPNSYYDKRRRFVPFHLFLRKFESCGYIPAVFSWNRCYNNGVHGRSASLGDKGGLGPSRIGNHTVWGGEIMISVKKSFGLMGALSFTLLSATLASAAADTIRVNCGATDTYVDSKGKMWAADSGYVGGQVYSEYTTDIAGTADPLLHQDERWDSQDFSYNFNVTPGSYIVKLYEASLYTGACGAGTRVFDVTINGTKVLTNYDMGAEVDCLTAQIKQFVVATADGKINVTFNLGTASNPKINAIEIVPGTVIPVQGAIRRDVSRFSVAGSNGALRVDSRAEGAYSLELSDLQGRIVSRKQGFGQASQTFTNLNPGLYFLTSRAGNHVATQKVSVVR